MAQRACIEGGVTPSPSLETRQGSACLDIRRHIATAACPSPPLTLAPRPRVRPSMPWDASLFILESIERPVAKIIAVMRIVITSLTLALGDTSRGARKLIQIVRPVDLLRHVKLLLVVLLVRRRGSRLMAGGAGHGRERPDFPLPVHRARKLAVDNDDRLYRRRWRPGHDQ